MRCVLEVAEVARVPVGWYPREVLSPRRGPFVLWDFGVFFRGRFTLLSRELSRGRRGVPDRRGVPPPLRSLERPRGLNLRAPFHVVRNTSLPA